MDPTLHALHARRINILPWLAALDAFALPLLLGADFQVSSAPAPSYPESGFAAVMNASL